MTKKKSVFITAIFVLMLAIIMFSAYRMGVKAFPVLVGILAVYGMIHLALSFCSWLELPSFDNEPIMEPIFGESAGDTFTYEEIRAEMERDE